MEVYGLLSVFLRLFLTRYVLIFNFRSLLTRGGINHAFQSRRHGFYAQPYGRGIHPWIAEIRNSVATAVDLARSGHGLKGHHFKVDVRCLHAVTSRANVFLISTQRVTQRVFRHSGEGVREVTRASGAYDFVNAITVRCAYRRRQLVDGRASDFAARTTGASRGINYPRLLCFRRIKVVRSAFSGIAGVMQLFQVYQGRVFGIRCHDKFLQLCRFDAFLIVPKSGAGRAFGLLRALLLTLYMRVDVADYFHVSAYAARVFREGVFTRRNLSRVQAYGGRLKSVLCCGCRIHWDQEVCNSANAESRSRQGLEGGAKDGYVTVRCFAVAHRYACAFLSAYAA